MSQKPIVFPNKTAYLPGAKAAVLIKDSRIEFAFDYYGKFVDMGVGKGVTLEMAGSVVSRRRPKPWYSKQFFAQVKKFSEILAAKYARKGVITIIENVDDNALRLGVETI